jgi:hypothetical protein
LFEKLVTGGSKGNSQRGRRDRDEGARNHIRWKVEKGIGLDSAAQQLPGHAAFQALPLGTVGVELEVLNKKLDGKLPGGCGPEGNFGFPKL